MGNTAANDVPDPESVSTPGELAYHLRLFKIHVGDPSVRAVSRKTGSWGDCLPPSTVQDVLSGKRGVPQLDNFMKVVLALGAMAGKIEAESWRQAWIRAKRHHRGMQTRPALPPMEVVANAERVDPASQSTSKEPSSAVLSRREVNIRKAEEDVKNFELELYRAEMSLSISPDRRHIAKRQLEAAKRRLALVDPGNYLLG